MDAPLAQCSDLPVEITDTIIDHFRDDFRTLQACTLVRRTWLPRSRHWLFRDFRFDHPAHDVASMFYFLKTTPEAASGIQQFRVSSSTTLSVTLGLPDFLELLKSLPNLRRLVLHNVTFKEGSALPSGPTAPHRIHQLHLLQLSNCSITIYDYPQLFRFLGFFSSIHRLELSTGGPIRDWFLTPASGCVPPYLAVEELASFDIPLPIVLMLVRDSRIAEMLQVLWLDRRSVKWPSDVHAIGAILGVLSMHRALRRITFGPLSMFSPPAVGHWEIGDAEQWGALHLARFTHLAEVNVRTRVLLRQHAQFCVHIPAGTREFRVTLVGFDNDHALRDPGADCKWDAFDREFSRGPFNRITFVLDLSHAKQKVGPVEYRNLVVRARRGLRLLQQQERLVINDTPLE